LSDISKLHKSSKRANFIICAVSFSPRAIFFTRFIEAKEVANRQVSLPLEPKYFESSILFFQNTPNPVGKIAKKAV